MNANGKLSAANSEERNLPVEYIRNLGIVAHIDAGKTTTTERMLFYAGVVHRMGEVHEGNATTDWMDLERERGITITAAAISCRWKTTIGLSGGLEHQINLIDTPGHVDFTAEVERSLRVLDSAVGVFCAVAGVQPQSETVWRQMDKYGVPRLAFVNKMDRMGASFFGAVDDISRKLGANAHPLFLPIGAEERFAGLIDLISLRAYFYGEGDITGDEYEEGEIPPEYSEQAAEYRERLIVALADFDEGLAAKYLEGEGIAEDEIRLAVRRATLSLGFLGVIPGSAFKNKGVQMLLNSVVDYLPSPLDVPPMMAQRVGREEVEIEVGPNDSADVAGLAFKITSDPYVGKLVFFRIYQGQLRKGSSLYNPRTGRMERISRLMIMKADARQDIEVAYSGEICAIIGAKQIRTGDTLCTKRLDIRLEPPTFPDPVISMSIEPMSQADQERLSIGLQRLAEEDPTFIVSFDAETGQTIISGMGELHLEILRDRLFREFRVAATAGRPEIAYREAVTAAAAGVGKFIRQSGGRGQYGHVELRMEPTGFGGGELEFENEIVGGIIPKEYMKPIEVGLREAALNGTLAGYPVVGLRIRLVFGSYHEVDSSELAFKMAAIFAFKDAMKKARPVLLEPIMRVEVSTPVEFQGDVMGDLNRRRGRIQGMEAKGHLTNVTARVPLETMFGYATDIRSISRGRASYTMEPAHFEKVPAGMMERLIESKDYEPART